MSTCADVGSVIESKMSVVQTSNVGFTSEVSDYLVVHTGPVSLLKTFHSMQRRFVVQYRLFLASLPLQVKCLGVHRTVRQWVSSPGRTRWPPSSNLNIVASGHAKLARETDSYCAATVRRFANRTLPVPVSPAHLKFFKKKQNTHTQKTNQPNKQKQ